LIKLNLNLEYGIIIIILVSWIALISWSNYGYGQNLSDNNNSVFSDILNSFEMPSESNSFSTEFMPNQNFTNFSNFNSSADYEMPQIYFPDVNGTYINSDIGYQIDLPKGWKGKEMNFMMNMVFATPHEINLEEIEEPGTMMTISGINKKSLDMLTYLTQLPSIEEGSKEELAAGIEDEEQSWQDSDSLSNPTSDSIMEKCNDFQTSPVTINGISAEQLTADCIDENGVNTNAKVYAFVTSDDSIIITLFYSNSNNEYNQYLPLFEESVKTIKITNPGDISKSETYKKYKELGIAIK
jgi:hypothetical protein